MTFNRTSKKDLKSIWIDLYQQLYHLKNLEYFYTTVVKSLNTIEIIYLIIIKKNKIKILIKIYFSHKYWEKVPQMKTKNSKNGNVTGNHQVKRKRIRFLNLIQQKNKNIHIKDPPHGPSIF